MKTFKLSVEPGLLREGEFAGHLETVHFIADSDFEHYRWWAVNTGKLETELSRIVSPELARQIVNRLENGETVELPNRYNLDEVRFNLGGNWGD